MGLIIRTSRILNDQVVLIILSFFSGIFCYSDPQNGPFLERFPPYIGQKSPIFFRLRRAQIGSGGLIILSLRILNDRVVLIIRTSRILNGPGGSY